MCALSQNRHQDLQYLKRKEIFWKLNQKFAFAPEHTFVSHISLGSTVLNPETTLKGIYLVPLGICDGGGW